MAWVGRLGGPHSGEVYADLSSGCNLFEDANLLGPFYRFEEIVAAEDLGTIEVEQQ